MQRPSPGTAANGVANRIGRTTGTSIVVMSEAPAGWYVAKEGTPPLALSAAPPLAASGRVVLVIFKSSWGEIDGYLPLLHALRRQSREWKIFAVFISPGLVDQVEHQQPLWQKLLSRVDAVFYPHRPKPRSLRVASHQPRGLAGYLRRIRRMLPVPGWVLALRRRRQPVVQQILHVVGGAARVDFILRDAGGDDPLHTSVQAACASARVVMYPCGTNPLILQERTGNFARNTPRRATADLVLVGSETDVDWFSKSTGLPVIPVGHPRYDQWWIDQLVADPTLHAAPEVVRSSGFRRRIVFYVRDIHPDFLSEDDFRYLVRTAAEEVLACRNSFLIVKPHPRQDLEVLRAQLEGLDPSRWMISSLPALQLASIADFVISMWSSTISDALAVGKPVVEYYRFRNENIEEFVRCEDGSLGSAYRYLGLSIPAETREELRHLVDDFFGDDPDPIWRTQRERAAGYFMRDNRSSERAVAAIVGGEGPCSTGSSTAPPLLRLSG